MAGKPVILIVENDQAMRQFLRRALESDFEIIEAADARRALELALHSEPDAILLDLGLPGFSGLEFCQTSSTLRFTHNIPIVILTGQPAAHYRELCIGLGATEYFEKPLDPTQLNAYLAKLLRNRPRERRAEERAQLRLVLKLRGTDSRGSTFETVTTSEELSAYGFHCCCSAPLEENALIDVFLKSPGEQWVGRARVVRREATDRDWKSYAFRFVREPCIWPPVEDRLPAVSSQAGDR